MATFVERVQAVVQAIAADIKALKVANGDLTSLTTTNKSSLVNAINELKALTGQPAGVQIDDLAGDGDSNVVWSADKVYDAILAAQNAVKDDLTNGAGEALDTLKELADALNNNPNFAAEIATALSKRVRVDAAQVFTALEKKQACDNIGVGDPDTDFVATYTAAKV